MGKSCRWRAGGIGRLGLQLWRFFWRFQALESAKGPLRLGGVGKYWASLGVPRTVFRLTKTVRRSGQANIHNPLLPLCLCRLLFMFPSRTIKGLLHLQIAGSAWEEPGKSLGQVAGDQGGVQEHAFGDSGILWHRNISSYQQHPLLEHISTKTPSFLFDPIYKLQIASCKSRATTE